MRFSRLDQACFAVAVAGIVLLEFLGFRGARVCEILLAAAAVILVALRTGGWMQNLALVVASVAVGLAATVAVSPLLFPKTGSATRTISKGDELVAHQDVVGWGPKHPGVFHLVKMDPAGRVVFDVHATIGATLHRQTVSAAGRGAVAFFGDSFIFGDGLDDGDTLPQAFANLNHGTIPVLNLGFSGWAPSQNLAALEHGLYRAELGRPRRMILFAALFQVERTACKGAFALGSGPRYVLRDRTLLEAGTCVGSRPRILSAALRTLRGLVGGAQASEKVTTLDVETFVAIIEAFAARARRDYDTGTTVLMEPGDDELIEGTGYDLAKVVAALGDAGIDVLVKAEPPAGEVASYQIAGDGHPTGLANRATAEQLEAHLRRVDPGMFGKAQ